jgi:hypothetical protein
MNFLATFFHGTSYELIFDKIWVGLHFGQFVTSSSGQPDAHAADHQWSVIRTLFSEAISVDFWPTLGQGCQMANFQTKYSNFGFLLKPLE